MRGSVNHPSGRVPVSSASPENVRSMRSRSSSREKPRHVLLGEGTGGDFVAVRMGAADASGKARAIASGTANVAFTP
ncbi:MAG: hypothetical protein ACLT2T_07425 [Bilophila wadsworthia]